MPEVDFGYDPLEDMAERVLALEMSGEAVVRVRYKGDDAWLVLGYDNISNLLRNDVEVPASVYFRRELDTLGNTLLQMEGDEHRAYKTRMNQWFSAGKVRSLADRILLPVIDQIIDDLGDRREVLLNVAVSRRLGFNVISRLLGVPVPREKESDVQEMISDLIQIKDPNSPYEVRRQIALAAAERTNVMLRPILAQRRARREDDIISYLIDLDVDGYTLTDNEILDHVRAIYLAGADSTGLMLGNIMSAILSRADLLDRMLTDRGSRRPIIEDLMRLEAVTGLMTRVAVKDMVVGGVEIPKGGQILLGVPGANRDTRHFPSPNEVRLDRPQRNSTLSFGAGAHFCLGHHLAKEELRLAINRLLDRLSCLRLVGVAEKPTGSLFRFVADGVPVRFDDILPAEAVPPPA
jgi:cytochrome P450